MIHLIYVSSTVVPLDNTQLNAILESAVRHNTELAVTGMLLYANGFFMQVLEGEAAAVDETYARILVDVRHHDLLILERNEISHRSFEQWHMGFHSLSLADVIAYPAYVDFFNKDFDCEKLNVSPGFALQMLQKFAGIHAVSR